MSRNTESLKRCGLPRAFTFVEMLVGVTLFVILGGMVIHWFSSQQRYQEQIMRISRIQQDMRVAIWKVVEEMKTARRVVWPNINADGSPRTDTRLVFKSFKGEIIAIYHRESDGTIRRCVIPNGPGAPVEDPHPIGRDIASATFTVMGKDNRLVSIHLQQQGVHYLDAVRLVND